MTVSYVPYARCDHNRSQTHTLDTHTRTHTHTHTHSHSLFFTHTHTLDTHAHTHSEYSGESSRITKPDGLFCKTRWMAVRRHALAGRWISGILGPLWCEFGTDQTVLARFCPWCELFLSQKSLNIDKLSLSCLRVVGATCVGWPCIQVSTVIFEQKTAIIPHVKCTVAGEFER